MRYDVATRLCERLVQLRPSPARWQNIVQPPRHSGHPAGVVSQFPTPASRSASE